MIVTYSLLPSGVTAVSDIVPVTESWPQFVARHTASPKRADLRWDDARGKFVPPPGAPAWSPATYNGKRCDANIVSLAMLAFDIDTACVADVAAATTWTSAIWSTTNNTASSPRCRLALPLTSPAAPDDAKRAQAWLVAHYAKCGIVVDPYAKALSQPFFEIRSIPIDPEYIFEHTETAGPLFDVGDVPNITGRPPGPLHEVRAAARDRRMVRARAYLEKVDPAVSGQGGHRQLFTAILKLRSFGLTPEEIESLILSDYNPRCVPPWSLKEIRHKIHDAFKSTQVVERDDRDEAPPVRSTDHAHPESERVDEPAAEPVSVPSAHPVAVGLDGVRAIRLGPDMDRVTCEAEEALARDGDVFVHAERLVRLAGPRLHTLSASGVLELLSRNAVFVDGKSQRVRPPPYLGTTLVERGHWPSVRPIQGVATYPIRVPGGRLLLEHGYDQESKYYLFTDREWDLGSPTREDAVRARDEILDASVDFPFAGEHDRATWLALVLTAICAPGIDGPLPFFLVEANTPGAGKGKLATLAFTIATGSAPPLVAPDPSEERQRSLLTSMIAGGKRSLILDNVAEFGGPSWDALATSPKRLWADRCFGQNQAITTWKHDLVLCITGNNLRLRGDMARRIAPMRLESAQESPESRTDFARVDFDGWLDANQARLQHAALTIVAAYMAAGEPAVPGVGAWGSFERWTRCVAHAVAWVGLPSPLLSRTNVESRVDAHGALEALLEGWDRVAGGCAMTTREFLARLYPDRARGIYPPDGLDDLRDAVECVAGEPLGGRAPSNQKFGIWLGGVTGRVVGGRRFVRPGRSKGTARWRVDEVDRETPRRGGPHPKRGGPGVDPGVDISSESVAKNDSGVDLVDPPAVSRRLQRVV